MRTVAAGWVRGFALFLAVPQLVTGAWAVVAPQSFYEEFPGFGPLLIAASPPFNDHLITDAGSGFLATGVVLAAAAATGVVGHLRLALLAYLAFALPHFVFHATNPAPGLTDVEDAANVAVLGAAVALPVALLLLTRPREDRHGRTHASPDPPAGAPEGQAEPR